MSTEKNVQTIDGSAMQYRIVSCNLLDPLLSHEIH